MYSQVRAEMCKAAGHVIPTAWELVSGVHAATNIFPDEPRARTTEIGDPVRMDISQRVDG